jgi:trehalose/maltose hydrolase-like predicted phosphorylase
VRQLGGGPTTFLALLDEQIRRRDRGRVPDVDEDPSWIIRETGRDPLRHRVTETLFTLGAGSCASRGSLEEASSGSVPLMLANGVYSGHGAGQHLLPGPEWTHLRVTPEITDDIRVLDLRTAVLFRREIRPDNGFRSMRFASVTDPGVFALRAEGPVGSVEPGPPLLPPSEGDWAKGRRGELFWARSESELGGAVSAVARQQQQNDGVIRSVTRTVAVVAAADRHPELGSGIEALRRAEQAGFDKLLARHRAAWQERWNHVDVRIPDDPQVELAVRFALFQLWGNVERGPEAAVGARGLSGAGYAGHVFWDADVFVLPAVAAMDPAAALAMLRYRLHHLPAARENARSRGYPGARFPWESAASGLDVTPTTGRVAGVPVNIRTGQLEEHVTADIAWSARWFADWTGAQDFLTGEAAPLFRDTARYWAARCRRDRDGRHHIDGVIGPDEYHENVDDNSFTNVMAGWNLRCAADIAESAGPDGAAEAATWRAIADSIVDGYDPDTGIYEQFGGYHRLDPTLVDTLAAVPVAADVLLGRAAVASSQIIKQPDVLMLHHLLPDEVAPGSLRPNLDFYGPRTAHGSSLSPAIAAALTARAGRPDESLELLRLACAIDLEDLTGTTASGLHMAALGGLVQAIIAGYAGITVKSGYVRIDPQLPSSWRSLELRLNCLDRRLRLLITAESVAVETSGVIDIRLVGGPIERLEPGRVHRLVRRATR